MTNAEFKIMLENRTVAFSVSVIKMLRDIPVKSESRNIRDQLFRSATAIGANYREANRAESTADFGHKLSICAKEASETEYWLLLLNELYPNTEGLAEILTESTQLTRLLGKSAKTAHGCSFTPCIFNP